MVEIKKTFQNKQLKMLEISGHTCFEEQGKDIVCAALSSIVITTVNALLRIDEESISYGDANGFICLKILKNNDIVEKLIINMLELLEELADQYPKNITIIE